MADLERQTLSIRTVGILVSAMVTIVASTIITSLGVVASIKEEITSVRVEISTVKTYSETEMRIVNLRLDALERQNQIYDKTFELMARSLRDISDYQNYKKINAK